MVRIHIANVTRLGLKCSKIDSEDYFKDAKHMLMNCVSKGTYGRITEV